MQNTISIHHSRQLEGRVVEAQQLLKDTAIYMQGFTNTAEELALLKITDTDRNKICDAFFDSAKAITDRQKEALDEKKTRLNLCYQDDDNSNFRGTAWVLSMRLQTTKLTETVNRQTVQLRRHSHRLPLMQVQCLNYSA